MIKVSLNSSDGYAKSRSFKTLAGARRFAQRYVGENPEIGSWYAVSWDGVCRVTVEGATLQELFTSEPAGKKVRNYTVAQAQEAVRDGKFAILDDYPRYDSRDGIIGYTTHVHGIYDTLAEFEVAWGKIEDEYERCGAYEGAYQLLPDSHRPEMAADELDDDIPF